MEISPCLASLPGVNAVTETVLVVNAGSSSITFQLFSVAAGDQLERPVRPWRNAWLGSADFDREANSSGKMLISRAGSRVSCYLIPNRPGADDRTPHAAGDVSA
jgi:hypothetical protein